MNFGETFRRHRTEKITFPVEGWATLRMSSYLSIRPDTVTVEYNDGSWTSAHILVTGKRINKSGLGAEHTHRFFGIRPADGVPEELIEEIRKRAPEWWVG